MSIRPTLLPKMSRAVIREKYKFQAVQACVDRDAADASASRRAAFGIHAEGRWHEACCKRRLLFFSGSADR
jgi:hypothetical protein